MTLDRPRRVLTGGAPIGGRPAIVVHGGAGGPAKRDERLRGVAAAATAGWTILSAGGSALDAVEAATRLMEADPFFNAGHGSALTRAGTVETDAIVMEGTGLGIGAVAVVRGVLYTATLARKVMELTPHVMLAGPAAQDFARQLGLDVTDDALMTQAALQRWQRDWASVPVIDGATPLDTEGDTVGAVALDTLGGVAAATSTGGVRGKQPGRVGDAPIVGSGAYADDQAGAASCTGEGEHIMRVCMAYAAVAALARGSAAHDGAAEALAQLHGRTSGVGGIIVVDRNGRLAWAHNTVAMPIAWRQSSASGAAFTAAEPS